MWKKLNIQVIKRTKNYFHITSTTASNLNKIKKSNIYQTNRPFEASSSGTRQAHLGRSRRWWRSRRVEKIGGVRAGIKHYIFNLESPSLEIWKNIPLNLEIWKSINIYGVFSFLTIEKRVVCYQRDLQAWTLLSPSPSSPMCFAARRNAFIPGPPKWLTRRFNCWSQRRRFF